MGITTMKRYKILISTLIILSCFLVSTATDALAIGGHGGSSLDQIVKRHLSRFRKSRITLPSPVLIEPDGEITTKKPLYNWHPVQGANRYGLIVHRVTPPQVPVYIKFNIRDTEKEQPWWRKMEYNTDYFFVVIAYNTRTKSISPLSDKKYFRVVKESTNLPPVASFTAMPESGPAPLTVKFDASQSHDPDGTVQSYQWDFENDGSFDGEGMTTTYLYGDPDTYTASLRVTDSRGAFNEATRQITVSNPLPAVTMNASPASIPSGGSTTLSWSSTNAESAFIDNGIGDLPADMIAEGSIKVSPAQTTIYTITVEGPNGAASDSAEVKVIYPPENVDYGLDDNEQQGGGGLVGERIRLLNGNSVESRSNLQFPSPNRVGLLFHAFYNSRSETVGSLGHGWTHTYGVSLDPDFLIEERRFMRIMDHTGRAYYFQEGGSGIYNGIFKERTYVKVEADEYVWYRLNGTRYCFSFSGELKWIEDENENRLELGYGTQGRVEKVTDRASGRILGFHYNADGRLEYISGPVTGDLPSGLWVAYGYDGSQNLLSVTYADGSGFTYRYADAEDLHNLIEKRDKSGRLLKSWSYDDYDRTVYSFNSDGKGVDISYISESRVDVTDAYGTLRSYILAEIEGRKRVTAMHGPAGAPYSESNVIRWVYDDGMRLIEVEYAGGTINRYQDFDDRGNPETVILAVGTSEEKTITYTFHPEMKVQLSRTEPSLLGRGSKVTIWDYDDDYDADPNESPTGLLTRIIERGFTRDETGDSVPYEYTTTFTYNGKGQVLSIDGPLPVHDDKTSFTYNMATGDLLGITTPIIGDTFLSDYDAAGRIGRVIDVNLQSKSFSYDGRGRITAVTNDDGGTSTTFVYNTDGQPESVTDPDGITRSFDYDAEYGRLTRIIDPEGNYVSYKYNEQGNRIEMSYYDQSDSRTYWLRYDYHYPEMRGKPWKVINPDETFTVYGYDSSGNMVSMTDPEGHTRQYGYDPLNRLTSFIEPGEVTTSYKHDIHGNLVKVIDAEENETTYGYDDMGRVISTDSPDTGTVAYVYDAADNPVRKIDANGIAVEYNYDSLNRLTASRYPDPSQDTTYTYDGGTYGMGRLNRITDLAGSVNFGYDTRGRLIEKRSMINGLDYTVSSTYTPGNRLSSITYPTGRTVTYPRNMSGKISGVVTTYNSYTTTMIDNISYLPFGPAAFMGMGSGVNNVFDELYRIKIANPGSWSERSYTYDANGNLTSINVTNDPWMNKNFTYDALNRLAEAEGAYGTISYAYDKVGNRLTRMVNDQVETYTYITGTNRIQEITDSNAMTFSYDANGNTAVFGNKTLIYNHNNRLIRSFENDILLGEYSYNGLGERVIKIADGAPTLFHCDLNGNLIAESLPDGTFISEYIYMGKGRLAKIDSSDNAIYYYLNNHLGTPQIMTDANGTVVWEAEYRPFGEVDVNPNSGVINNFRLPGQYYDQETGLHYNYFRDYHPMIGRYVEPDPIGLMGGINLYSYASNNPVILVDPYGLFSLRDALKNPRVTAVLTLGASKLAEYAAKRMEPGKARGAVYVLSGGLATASAYTAMQVAVASYTTAITTAETGVIIAGGLIVGSAASYLIFYDLVQASEYFEKALEDFNYGSLSTIPESYEYPPGWLPEFQYDPDNPDEIEQNSSVPVSVIGGSPPFLWDVSGNGFILSQSQTTGLSNTLHADGSACGTATITVRDGRGTTAKGYVRCSDSGIWVVKGSWEAVIPSSGSGWDCKCGEMWSSTGCHWRRVFCKGECCCYMGQNMFCDLQDRCSGPLSVSNFYVLGTTGAIVWGTFVNNIFDSDHVVVVEYPDHGNCNDSPWDWSWPSDAIVEGNTPPYSPGECGLIIGSDCVRDYSDDSKPIGVKWIRAYKYQCP